MMWFVVPWLLSPLVVIALLTRHRTALNTIRKHNRSFTAIGCAGGAAMLTGVICVHSTAGLALFVVGTPLIALAPFRRRTDNDDRGEDDDGGGGGGGGPGRDGGPPFNWPQFEREFWAHVSAQRTAETSSPRAS